jgi:hypothetical protein
LTTKKNPREEGTIAKDTKKINYVSTFNKFYIISTFEYSMLEITMPSN